jgi:hypothetical protein
MRRPDSPCLKAVALPAVESHLVYEEFSVFRDGAGASLGGLENERAWAGLSIFSERSAVLGGSIGLK